MSVLDPVILNQLSSLSKSMADTLAALSASVGTVDGKVVNVNNGVATVSGQVTTVTNAVAALQGTANTINNTVNTINAKATGIKSVQRGVISWAGALTSSITIAPVNVAKAELRLLGGPGNLALRITLENASTVKVEVSSQDGTMKASWELTEWN